MERCLNSVKHNVKLSVKHNFKHSAKHSVKHGVKHSVKLIVWSVKGFHLQNGIKVYKLVCRSIWMYIT